MFKIKKQDYIVLQITPKQSNNQKRLNVFGELGKSMTKSISKRFYKENKDIVFELGQKFMYVVRIKNNEITFLFVVPKEKKVLITEKIRTAWGDVTIQELEVDAAFQNKKFVAYETVEYSKKDGLSLDVKGTLLSDLIQGYEFLSNEDTVDVVYNIAPYSHTRFLREHENDIEEFELGMSAKKNGFNLKSGAVTIFELIQSIVNDLLSIIVDDIKSNAAKKRKKRVNEVSSNTRKKLNSDIFSVQILIASNSNEKKRAESNVKYFSSSFSSLSEDNSLKSRKTRRNLSMRMKNEELKINFLSKKLEYAHENKMSVHEMTNFLRLPNAETIRNIKAIKRIEQKESKVDDLIKSGNVKVGTISERGQKSNVYLQEDPFTGLFISGDSGSGKSTFIQNIALDMVKNGQCVVIPDYIEECGLSEKLIDEAKKNNIGYTVIDLKRDQSLAFDEIDITNINDSEERFEMVKNKADCFINLLDSLQAEDADLTPKMYRICESAAVVGFLNNATINDVFNILTDEKERHRFIESLSHEDRKIAEMRINNLKDIDEVKNGKIIGTKVHQGIVDRYYSLCRNRNTERMLMSKGTENVNLVEEFQKPQFIIIKMPETRFPSQEERDVICTFWMLKSWLAVQRRMASIQKEKRVPVTLFLDEIYQLKISEKFVASKINQARKFGIRFALSFHYPGQCRTIKKEILASGCSFFLLGRDPRNFDEFERQVKGAFTVDDFVNLKAFHSINILNTRNGAQRFIAKMPDVL